MDKVDKSIHEVLPVDIIAKLLTDHCDIKTVAKFQTTSSLSNIPDVKESKADKLTNDILYQVFANIFEYRALLNNREKLRGMMKPVMQTFVDAALTSFMRLTIYEFPFHRVQPQEVDVKIILGRIKARTGLSSRSLMQILRAFQYDTPVPDSLSTSSEQCLTILMDYLTSSSEVWKIHLDTHEMYIHFSTMIVTFVISVNDADKVREWKEWKPETFLVRSLGHKRRNHAAVHFKLTLENIGHLAKIIQHLYGRYALVKKDTIEIKMKLSKNILATNVMKDFQKTYFKSLIKI